MQKISQDEVDFIAFHVPWVAVRRAQMEKHGMFCTDVTASLKIGKKRRKNRQSLAVSALHGH
jgi:hypothetical protein